MNEFLHSLPWTIALALAQAGDESPSPSLHPTRDPSDSPAHLSGETSNVPEPPLRLNADEARPRST